VKITTSIGSIGIRGTEFWGGSVPGGHGVFVDDGAVSFSGAWGNLDLPAGSGIFIPENMGAAKIDRQYWNSANKALAMDRVTFGQPGLEEKLAKEKRENFRRRNDYRGRAFPNKPSPKHYKLNGEDDEFFTDEFNEMRENKGYNR
jgi:hypothetical protein